MNFGNQIANLIYSKFNELPKKGKPQPSEWTCVAGIVLEVDFCEFSNQKTNATEQNLFVIALSTGSKVQTAKSVNIDGYSVLDSHAEVICRRAFQRFLFHQIQLCLQLLKTDSQQQQQQNVNSNNFQNLLKTKQFSLIQFVTNEENKFQKFDLKKGLKFHFFISQSPCK